LSWYVAVWKQVTTCALDDFHIVCDSILNRHAVQKVIDQESGGKEAAAPMHSLVQRQGTIDTHEPSIALINEALSVLLCLEGPVLKEEVVDLLNNFISVGVFAGGQDGRAKVLGNLRVFWCWRWRGRAAVGL
jgi:hypothetical protein